MDQPEGNELRINLKVFLGAGSAKNGYREIRFPEDYAKYIVLSGQERGIILTKIIS